MPGPEDPEDKAWDKACEAELDRLAKAWVALWESELAALAADPEVASIWRQAIGLGAAWARAAQGAPDREAPVDAGPAAPGTPAAGLSPRPGAGDALGGGDPAGLRSRIEALEQRLAALERGPAGGGAPHGKPRRKRPSA